MNYLNRYLSISIFNFEIGWAETKIMWFEDFGQQPNWKLKGHNQSDQKYQNGFFLISSIWLMDLIETNGIRFGWVELILSTFEDTPTASNQGRSRVKRR